MASYAGLASLACPASDTAGIAGADAVDAGRALKRRLVLFLAAAANLTLALAAWTRQPWTNGPSEWRWQYLPPAADTGRWAGRGGAAAAVMAGLAVLGIVLWHRRLAAWRGAMPLAVAGGIAFSIGLIAAQPGGFARVFAALVSRNSFGYVWDAALAPPSRVLLADYPAASAALGQHSLTHPPGPLLVVRAAGVLDRILPPPAHAGRESVTGGIANPAVTGAPRRDGLASLAAAAVEREVARAKGHLRPVPPSPPGPWSLVALALLLPALSACAAWPLYRLALCWGWERPEALLAAVLWLLVPARSLFTPSFDQVVPLVLVGAAWLACQGGGWRSAAAGALLFAACFLSYGCLPLLPLVVACAAGWPRSAPAPVAIRSSQRDPDACPQGGAEYRPQRNAAALSRSKVSSGAGGPAWTAMALGFALPYLGLAAAGHNSWLALRAALALHHRIAVAPRSYATWLLWNPYDFALLLSPGVLLLAAVAAGTERPRPGSWRLAAWCWWASLALLLMSGGVRGEVGRIWLPWMPFACLFAAAAAAGRSGPRRIEVALLLAAEAALTLVLAARMVFVS